ncbi:hypothetical protein PTE31013_03839 [Pandoraea terrigena]|uniref:Lipoprotein n=1 Tax=Pandoraea terrigena TaxID=2508292 RepID=A0A5E4XDK5_9BURK|nr:hypothetical protein PTE31013_03839 [Pandoraea terrigena]
MSKILSISLNAIKALGLLAALSGCSLAQNMEQDFPYELRIENKLTAPIAYCEDFEAETCPHVVQSGQSDRQIFMSHVANGSDEKKLAVFDRQKIKVCGKLIDVKLIRSVSPVVKRDKDHFEIVIDKAVHDKFCP